MKIAIATTTRYARVDKLRAQLALELMRTAQTLGITVITLDESPMDEFRPLAQNAEAIVLLPQEKRVTMGSGRRQAIRTASKLAGPKGIVIWTEPEKEPLVGFLPALCELIRNDTADIVIPARTAEGFQSYPFIQALAEQLGNEIFRFLTGLKLDVWFGPRILSPKAVPYFLDYQGDYGDHWDSTFIPLLRAQAAGLRLVGTPVEYRHPALQTAQEQQDMNTGILKRLEQLQNLVTALCKERLALGQP